MRRIQSAKHEKEDPTSLAPHYLEGRTFGARLLEAEPVRHGLVYDDPNPPGGET